jgi:hypothetical protein
MGADVHDSDVFSSVLGRPDSEAAKSPARRSDALEVINCGISGYGTHEERQFYRTLSAAYHPDIVLVMIGVDDDRYYRERAERDAFSHVGPIGRLFSLWGRVEAARHAQPVDGYSQSAAELVDLGNEVRQQGGQMFVALFQYNDDPRWTELSDAVKLALKATGIPVIDLGAVLVENPRNEDLMSRGTGSYPNELAHRIVAHDLRAFLQQHAATATSGSTGH